MRYTISYNLVFSKCTQCVISRTILLHRLRGLKLLSSHGVLDNTCNSSVRDGKRKPISTIRRSMTSDYWPPKGSTSLISYRLKLSSCSGRTSHLDCSSQRGGVVTWRRPTGYNLKSYVIQWCSFEMKRLGDQVHVFCCHF